MIATLDTDFWNTAYNFLRLFSPMLFLVAFQGATERGHPLLWLASIALSDPRVLFQLAPQVLGVFGIHLR